MRPSGCIPRSAADECVCCNLGGGDPVSGQVEMAVRELGASRVLYGSDVAVAIPAASGTPPYTQTIACQQAP